MMTFLTSNRFSFIVIGSLIFASASAKAGDASPSESTYLANIKQITDTSMGFTKAGEAYFSPDGNSIIFQATPQGKDDYQIYTLVIGSHEAKMVSTGKGACTCAYFRPDGKKIIFASSHLDPGLDKPQPPKEKKNEYKWDFNSYMDIFESNPDGTGLKRLTDAPGYDAEGSYSHDGRLIVFTSQRDGDLEIYVMDAYGTNARRITNAKGYDGGPFFSPDDQTILYRGDHRDDGKMNLQLRMVNVDGTNDHALTENAIFNWCPYWHPSGKSFIFTQADHGAYARGEKPNYDLFMMRADGSGQTRITFDPDFDGLPVFSPDGNRLMWTSKRGGLPEAQVFIADFKLPYAFK